jgi:hypothetical protein
MSFDLYVIHMKNGEPGQAERRPVLDVFDRCGNVERRLSGITGCKRFRWVWPVFMSYVPGFIYVGICWNKLQYVCRPFTSRTTYATR